MSTQEALKAEYYLWQLFQIERDMGAVRQEVAKHKDGLNDVAKLLHASEGLVEEKKQAAAGVNKERMLLERKYKKRKADLDKKAGSLSAPDVFPRQCAVLGEVDCVHPWEAL
jgi:structural maintenance of chromosome 1